MVLGIEEIMKILPHRPPMLLVDKILEIEPFKSATGLKNITMNEPQFIGHFPNHPIFPGVLQLEAMAQVGGVAMLYPEEHRGKIALFGGMDNIKFKSPIVPGDTLITKAEIVKVRGNFGVLHSDGYVDDKLVASADFKFALKTNDELFGLGNKE